VKARSK